MAEPINAEVARGRLGIVSTHRDAEINQLISAAREHVEDLAGIALVIRQVREPIAALEYPTFLTSRPIRDVLSIDYVDAAGVTQSIADARLVAAGRGFMLQPVIDGAWPDDATEVFAVLEVGFAGDANDPYPPKLIQAMLVLVAHWFDDPQGTKPIPATVADLCYQARSWLF